MNNGSSQIAVKPSFRGTRRNSRKCHHIDRERARASSRLLNMEIIITFSYLYIRLEKKNFINFANLMWKKFLLQELIFITKKIWNIFIFYRALQITTKLCKTQIILIKISFLPSINNSIYTNQRWKLAFPF